MPGDAILCPMLAMVLLTAVVAAVMYVRRIGEMRRRRIGPQQLATSAQTASALDDSRASDNFRNLFEAPVLFYAAVLTVHSAQLAEPKYVVLAWLFVAARVVHSAIHCTYNRVMHRFTAFIASLAVLWVLWGVVAYDLLVVR